MAHDPVKISDDADAARSKSRGVAANCDARRGSAQRGFVNTLKLRCIGVFVAGLMAALTAGGCSVFGIRSGTEQPNYTVVETLGDNVEVRQYETRLAAEVVVTGEEGEARSAGFRKLADFIFGENLTRESIAMTAPVSQAALREIAMTAPVAQAQAGPGQWRVRFLMPNEFTRETLPVPVDSDITILDLPPETVAVIRFSGSRSPTAVHEATNDLLQVIRGGHRHISGEPRAFFYDPPWTLSFLRRNEVAIPVMPN